MEIFDIFADALKNPLTKELVRSGTQLHLEGETQVGVHGSQEIEQPIDLRIHLLLGAEDVLRRTLAYVEKKHLELRTCRVILLKSSHSRKSCERTGGFVAVQDAKVSDAHRQLAV